LLDNKTLVCVAYVGDLAAAHAKSVDLLIMNLQCWMLMIIC